MRQQPLRRQLIYPESSQYDGGATFGTRDARQHVGDASSMIGAGNGDGVVYVAYMSNDHRSPAQALV